MQIDNVVCTDFTINQLLQKQEIAAFMEQDGYVFVGGFAYGDILGSGVATTLIIKNQLNDIFTPIFADEKKFVLGVCNGCQILVKLGLFGDKVDICENLSKKFESRWLPVNWNDQMIGIWVAHGEGRFDFKPGWDDDSTGDANQIFGTYISADYPLNPNGSMLDAIGIRNGRGNHIALMPHPERSVFKWQCEYIPAELAASYEGPYTPWIDFFQQLIEKVM